MMKAAYIESGKVCVGELPDPVPTKGQALVRTHRCGLCASDAHFLHSGQHAIDLCRRLGGPFAGLEFERPFVPGHEFVGEVVDYGPGSRRTVKPGRKVTSAPVMLQSGTPVVIGYSHVCPGGFGEFMLLDEDWIMEVPSDVPDDHAAMIEPLAVGLEHARRGRPEPGDAALVLGCGAIGLGVIAGLKLMGIAPIVAADFHEGRRNLAIAMGAHIAVDPREMSPYAALPDFDGRSPNVIYECVGAPGMMQRIIEAAPFQGRIVMGGYCMEQEPMFVFAAQNKGLNIQFCLGEEPQDMELAMRSISDGRIDVTPWLGASVGLKGVAQALDTMSSAGAPIRTVVDPRQA